MGCSVRHGATAAFGSGGVRLSYGPACSSSSVPTPNKEPDRLNGDLEDLGQSESRRLREVFPEGKALWSRAGGPRPVKHQPWRKPAGKRGPWGGVSPPGVLSEGRGCGFSYDLPPVVSLASTSQPPALSEVKGLLFLKATEFLPGSESFTCPSAFRDLRICEPRGCRTAPPLRLSEGDDAPVRALARRAESGDWRADCFETALTARGGPVENSPLSGCFKAEGEGGGVRRASV